MTKHLRHRLLLFALLSVVALLSACGGYGEVGHADYGDCRRSIRHIHNDHVFIADYHDHALCEWLQYE